MKILLSSTLAFVLVGAVVADEKKPTADPYAELFCFPATVTLDEGQKDKLADLKKSNEGLLAGYDSTLKNAPDATQLRILRDKLQRVIIRKKNAILTDDQRKTLGIRDTIPRIAEEKSLSDPKVWDVSRLEKNFTIDSRNFDPEEFVVSFMVITKRKWTDAERLQDGANWSGGTFYESPIQAVFYNRFDETFMKLTGPYVQRIRGNPTGQGGVTRVPAKLTDKQEEEGLLRYRIRIDLDSLGVSVKEAASVKLICPELKTP